MKNLAIQIPDTLHKEIREAKKEFESRSGKITVGKFIQEILSKGLKLQKKQWHEIDIRMEEIKKEFI